MAAAGLGRRIVALALPSLGVLATEPLYLLFDIAVVGRLGAVSLAGLAIGGLIVTLVSTQLTFLSYATTARSARFYGAGDRAAAVREGVQASWLAIGIGLAAVVAVQAAGGPLVALIAGSDGEVADAARTWLRIAILAAPAILLSLAGNGWMRGIQDTGRPLRYVLIGFGVSAVLCPLLVYGWAGLPRWGLAGSAVANVIGQWLAGLLFCRALFTERVSLRPDGAALRAQVVMGRDLVVRTVAFQACFLSAAAVAARFGAAALAAHQVVLQLWSFLALVLDSLAIAAQSLVGAALGAGDPGHARKVAWRVTAYSALAAVALGILLAAGATAVPALFTGDRGVLDAITVPWWFLVLQMPIAGVLFALDGVLMGAGDAAFLRTVTVASALLGFLPLTWLSLVFGWGLAGIWSGLTAFLAIRLVFGAWRVRSNRWAVTGVC